MGVQLSYRGSGGRTVVVQRLRWAYSWRTEAQVGAQVTFRGSVGRRTGGVQGLRWPYQH